MKALVTGGAGFVGSHLVDALVARGDDVLVVDDLSTGRPHQVSPAARFTQLDISDRQLFDEAVDGFCPNAIYHIAAQSSVTVSTKRPERDAEVNVLGTLFVAEAARRHSSSVVFTSTGGALYGDDAVIPTPETAAALPLSPYGASKASGEVYLSTWARAHSLPVAICRLGNVFGPRQRPDGEAGVISIFAYHLWRGQAPLLFGGGSPSRDYVHVSDVVRALVAARGTTGTFNIATGIETTTRQIFDLVAKTAETDIEPIGAPLRPGELQRSCMDPTHARLVLGWSASRSVEVAVPETCRSLSKEFSNQENERRP